MQDVKALIRIYTLHVILFEGKFIFIFSPFDLTLFILLILCKTFLLKQKPFY